jgi:hypothetical protein
MAEDSQQPGRGPDEGDAQIPDEGAKPQWPGVDDLSVVLTRVVKSRKAPEAGKRLAGSPETRAYLDAGLKLIAEQLTAPEGQPQNGDYTDRPFFSWLSRAKVIEEASKMAHSSEKGTKLNIGEGNYRDRWKYQPDYVEDLLAYSLWAVHWSAHVATAEGSAEALKHGDDFVDAIHELSYRDTNNVLSNPAYRVSVIGSAMADRDARAREMVTQTYRLLLDSWKQLYTETIEARGFRLRPDVSVDDLANMLAALADGIGLRLITTPGDGSLIDHENHRSLLGKAALALVASCIDAGDGLGLEEVVRLFTAEESGGL